MRTVCKTHETTSAGCRRPPAEPQRPRPAPLRAACLGKHSRALTRRYSGGCCAWMESARGTTRCSHLLPSPPSSRSSKAGLCPFRKSAAADGTCNHHRQRHRQHLSFSHDPHARTQLHRRRVRPHPDLGVVGGVCSISSTPPAPEPAAASLVMFPKRKCNGFSLPLRSSHPAILTPLPSHRTAVPSCPPSPPLRRVSRPHRTFQPQGQLSAVPAVTSKPGEGWVGVSGWVSVFGEAGGDFRALLTACTC